MNSDQVIFNKIEDSSLYDQLLAQAIDYAILSIPFTFDRMGIRDLKKKIINIAKGKFAENLFFHFLSANKINFDNQMTNTPFYSIDKRDFILKNIEWDIKNNFLIHENETLKPDEYIKLLGLIPYRGDWDQWGKRNIKYFPNTTSCGYVFTFMQKKQSKNDQDFFDLKYTFKQEMFLRDLYEKFQGKQQPISPYESKWFWHSFESLGGTYKLNCNYRPQMVITAIALPDAFSKFDLYKPSQVTGKYMRTIIPNMGIPIGSLDSFKEFVFNND